jgi:hypothetical protein
MRDDYVRLIQFVSMMSSVWASVRIDSAPDGNKSNKLDRYDLEHSTGDVKTWD